MEQRDIIVDTDIIVDFLRGTRETLRFFAPASNLFITSITAFELLYGALKSKRQEELDKILEFMSFFNSFDFDKEAAKKAAEIKYSLERKGEPLDIRDIFIAACCQTNGCPLLTRNVKHFQKIEGLKILEFEHGRGK